MILREVNRIAGKSDNLTGDQFLMHRIGVFGSWFAIFVLVFASVRGWAVLNLNISPALVYGFSSLLLIVMAGYGFNCRARIKDVHLSTLRNLLLINGVFGFLYVTVAILILA